MPTNVYDNYYDALCTCGAWWGVDPPPPCPVHPAIPYPGDGVPFPPPNPGVPYFPPVDPNLWWIQRPVERTWTTDRVTFDTPPPDDGPTFDGPTEEFVLTLGLTPGYSQPSSRLKPKLAVATFLKRWNDLDVGVDTIPVRVALERVGYPGGEEDIIVATGTRNPYWMSDPVTWRQRVLSNVKALKEQYKQATAQVTFSQTWLVYYRDED